MNLTEKELNILLHSLGLKESKWYHLRNGKLKEPYRNRFVTSETSDDYSSIKSLIDKGLMIKGDRPPFIGDMDVFFVSDKGIILTKDIAHKQAYASKPSRSKMRYLLYKLSESDETFINWLKDPHWREYRKAHGV